MQVIKGNIFNSEYLEQKDTMLLHCISSDYAMGYGFAKEIENRYHIRDYLMMVGKHTCPDIIPVDNIINIITTDNYWHRGTYEKFNVGLILAREYCHEKEITRLVMPAIGSGYSRLDWESCYKNIKYLIDEFDIDCIMYKL